MKIQRNYNHNNTSSHKNWSRSFLRTYSDISHLISLPLASLSAASLVLTFSNFALAAPTQDQAQSKPKAQLGSTSKTSDKTISPQPSSSNSSKANNFKINPIVFKPRPSQGKPLETIGAGTRSNDRCVADRTENLPSIQSESPKELPSLTLVVPKLSENITVSDRPTFWFYVPKSQAKTIEFSLFEKTPNALGEYKTGVYQVSFPITRQSVVSSYTLPANAPALAVGKKYEWAIALICEPNNRQRDLNASSTVTRIDLNTDQQTELSQTEALQRVEFFAKNGIWSDMITTLSSKFNNSDGQVTNQAWQNLLKSEPVQLDSIADQPLQP